MPRHAPASEWDTNIRQSGDSGKQFALGLTVLAIAQMGIHLVFFLHVTSGPDNTNNVMALAFGVLIVVLVVVGSLLIMADLNDSMMPSPELMNLQMQH